MIRLYERWREEGKIACDTDVEGEKEFRSEESNFEEFSHKTF
jgi:hypothetical protein